MGMDPFPAEHELIELFECEPGLGIAGVPWTYNELRFDTTRGADRIICEIAPGYEELQLRWLRDDTEVVYLRLRWVSGLEVKLGPDAEALIATFRNEHLLQLRLQLKPTLHLRWGTSPDP
jgi:hypothetical protein